MSARQPIPTWDPTTLLDIINTDAEYNTITCLGYAPSKDGRCCNPIRAKNRNKITRILKEMSMLRPESEGVDRKLSVIAGLGLCIRVHQGQMEGVVRGWKGVIANLESDDDYSSDDHDDDSESPIFGDENHSSDYSDFSHFESADDETERHSREMMEKSKEDVRVLEEEMRRQKQPKEMREREKKEERIRMEKERKASDARLRRRKEEEEEERKEQKEQQRREEEQQREKEEKQKREDEKAQNERIRLKADQLKKERLREASEKATKEREEWNQAWATYQTNWKNFRPSVSTRSLKSSIPWPVKSGLYEDVNKENVKLFMTTAGPRDENVVKLAKKELLRWHPDKSNVWARSVTLTDIDRLVIEMISVVATDLMNKAGRK